MKVDFYRHQLGAADAGAVAKVLSSPFLTTGKVCGKVEEQLRQYFGVPHAILTNSWTNGAVATLLAMDIGAGDEVIIPAMTFVATANVVALAGATPIFSDVDPDTLLLTSELVAPLVTERTRAIIPVHLYGQMCDIRAMRTMLNDHTAAREQITLIEDCAHCFEGSFEGRKPGEFSDAAIFSFYATKNVTCGEGGAIIFRDEQLYKNCLQTRMHGMSAMAVDRFASGQYNHWDVTRLGTKANLPDLLAALLPGQISSVDYKLVERHRLAERYREAFAGGPIRLVSQLQRGTSAEHVFPIGVPGTQRDAAIAALNKVGVSVTVNYRAVPDTKLYSKRNKGASERCPVSHVWGAQTLTLPLFPGLTTAEQNYVIDAVQEHVYPLVDMAARA